MKWFFKQTKITALVQIFFWIGICSSILIFAYSIYRRNEIKTYAVNSCNKDGCATLVNPALFNRNEAISCNLPSDCELRDKNNPAGAVCCNDDYNDNGNYSGDNWTAVNRNWYSRIASDFCGDHGSLCFPTLTGNRNILSKNQHVSCIRNVCTKL